MNKRSPFLVLTVSAFFLFFSCKKINEATELGRDLIPAVDNVSTFDTTLTVETFNELFTDAEDSTRSTRTDEQFLGKINNDPAFGQTEATMFFELKPATYKFSFPFKRDSLVSLDSVVLVLSYRETYGDSTIPQSVRVFEINNNKFTTDSAYFIRRENFTAGSAISPLKTFIPQTLDDSVFPFGEKAKNQLRIPLDASFGNRLLNYDTTNAYASDSAFKQSFKGFAVAPQNNGSANALVGFNLSDTNSKLAFYLKYKNAGRPDTSVVVYFRSTAVSGAANYIKRTYTGSQLAASQGGTTPDNLLYIQSAPGSYARIRVPGLQNLSNRIIHRAELIAEQVYDPYAVLFPPPTYLFLDAFDSTKNRYRIIPYDLNATPTGQTYFQTFVYQLNNPNEFGLLGKATSDNSGNAVRQWRFNVSRYIQNVVTDREPAYSFRLSAPYAFTGLVGTSTNSFEAFIPLNLVYGKGRAVIGGGNNTTNPLRLYIIYSRL